MKKISKFFMLFAVLVMGMGLAFQSCGGVTASTLAAEMAKKCPKDLGEGLTLHSVTAQDNYVVLTIVVPDPVPVDVVKAAFEQDRAGIISILKESDPEISENLDAMGALGCGLKVVLQNSNGKSEIKIEPSELVE